MTRLAQAPAPWWQRFATSSARMHLAGALLAMAPFANAASGSAAAAMLVRTSQSIESTAWTASVLTVNSAFDSDDGVCDVSNCTLREAINAAQVGDTIVFSSLFNSQQTITFYGVGLPPISVDLTITGPGANLLILNGIYLGTDYSMLQVNAGATVTITGVTINGGHAESGGAIDNAGGLTLRDSVLSNSFAVFGGGIYSNGQTLIERTTIIGNSSGDGGGVYVASPGAATLTNVTITRNSAEFGTGGMATTGSGGVALSATLTNCTLAYNHGATEDSLAPFDSDNATSTVIQIRNTLFASSGYVNINAYGANASVTSLGHNLADDLPAAFIAAGDQIYADALLAPLGLSGPTPTYVLRLGSPAQDAGTATGAPATDQRGVARPQGGVVDIGAVEMHPLVVNSTADPGDGTCDATCTLRDALTAANADGGGADDIQFASAPFSSAQTINLTAALPNIDSSLSLLGPGANRLTVRRDTGGDYGILTINPGVSVYLNGITLANGKSGFGGGIANYGGILTLDQCTVRDNVATSNAGGVQNDGILNIVASTISGNTAAFFGGVLNYDSGVALVTNSTISGNTATAANGGVANVCFGGIPPNLIVRNTTIVNNIGGGGGLASIDNGGQAITYFESSIIANNTLPNLAQSGANAFLGSRCGNVLSDDGSGLAAAQCDLINTDPLLTILGYFGGPTQTHMPRPGSPALDIAIFDLPDTDQRGMPRPSGPGTDAGSVERQLDEIFRYGFE